MEPGEWTACASVPYKRSQHSNRAQSHAVRPGGCIREVSGTLSSQLEQDNSKGLSYCLNPGVMLSTTVVQSPEWPSPHTQCMPSLSGGSWGNKIRPRKLLSECGLRTREVAKLGCAAPLGTALREPVARNPSSRMLSRWALSVSVPTLLSFLLALQGGSIKPALPSKGQGCGPAPRPTSGWNCCSVRVWQYWQASPFSHLPGSPHSSPCFTFGHGDDLIQWGGGGCQMDAREDLGDADEPPLWSPCLARPGAELGKISCRGRAVLGPEARLCFSGPAWLHHQEGHFYSLQPSPPPEPQVAQGER